MIVVVSPFFIKYFVAGKNVSAITLFPFIVLRDEKLRNNERLINHEMIHIKQQLELLIVGFYILYLSEYAVRVLLYRNHYKAYRLISFEQEAYDNENDMDYLKKRKLWSFLKKSYFLK